MILWHQKPWDMVLKQKYGLKKQWNMVFKKYELKKIKFLKMIYIYQKYLCHFIDLGDLRETFRWTPFPKGFRPKAVRRNAFRHSDLAPFTIKNMLQHKKYAEICKIMMSSLESACSVTSRNVNFRYLTPLKKICCNIKSLSLVIIHNPYYAASAVAVIQLYLNNSKLSNGIRNFLGK